MYKTNFTNDDFELSRRVWRSIETLFNESGLRKNLRSKPGERSVYQHSISPNFLFHASGSGVKFEKSTITLKYIMNAERIPADVAQCGTHKDCNPEVSDWSPLCATICILICEDPQSEWLKHDESVREYAHIYYHVLIHIFI